MIKENIISTVKEKFAEYLKKNNLRKTHERFTILDKIYSFNTHFDIESLYNAMKRKNYRVTRATLYNTLELLVKCNLVLKHQFGKNCAQFEKAYGNKQHDHLICTECGQIIEFSVPRIQKIISTTTNMMNFSMAHHSLYIYGVCDECK